MDKINYESLEKKWINSKEKIRNLVKEKDVPTINMLKFYKLYIESPYNRDLKSLFEISFNGWYNSYMKQQ